MDSRTVLDSRIIEISRAYCVYARTVRVRLFLKVVSTTVLLSTDITFSSIGCKD